MSLVLNTNESSSDIVINKEFGQYPDVRQLLLAPSNSVRSMIPNSNGSYGYECLRYVLPGFFTGHEGATYGNQSLTTGSFSLLSSSSITFPYTVNFSSKVLFYMNSPLNGGEIVGKNIVIAPYFHLGNYINTTSGTSANQMQTTDGIEHVSSISIYLYHSDGTKTLIHTFTKSYNITTRNIYINTSANYQNNNVTSTRRVDNYNGNGIEALPGDYIVAEVSFTYNGTINNITSYASQIYFVSILYFGQQGGYVGINNLSAAGSGTLSGSISPRPIQISVD